MLRMLLCRDESMNTYMMPLSNLTSVRNRKERPGIGKSAGFNGVESVHRRKVPM